MTVPGPRVRVRLTLAYDGSGFHGFAPNSGVRTVGGVLIEALARILGHRIELTCAGRTDKGVHAHGQVVDFVTMEGTDLDALARSVNALCRPAIAVRAPVVVPDHFSSRFDATSRRYRYCVHRGEVPDPFSVGTAWHVPAGVDLDRLRLAADPFIGTHDFTSFCRRAVGADGAEKSSVRDVGQVQWEVVDEVTLRCWIEASSFCHQMVRSMVGTMVDVGLGTRSAGEIRGMLAARDRAAAGRVAPPHGLSLYQVRYPTP